MLLSCKVNISEMVLRQQAGRAGSNTIFGGMQRQIMAMSLSKIQLHRLINSVVAAELMA